ncbi:MAG TPA: penicillin-insensitive murein endopeptidase [Polyangiaceae bacterium]|jgi:penicillin-insensitive murein endopeptidase|nr:penicillin-insensitive murein endopeptidase [Polyangiaceae bacterium]
MNSRVLGLLAVAVTAVAGASTTFWARSASVSEEVRALTSEPERGQAVAISPPDVQPPVPVTEAVVHPLASLTDDQIGELVKSDPSALGSMSLGLPNRGMLFNAVEFPESPLWKRADPPHSWGTRESVEFVEYGIKKVNELFPDTPPLYVGDFSARNGGRLRPHKSHQSGRDVDIGYYYLDQAVWYRRADSRNLDRARTWTLLKALITHSPVEYVFMDSGIQPLLKEYALAQGEDPEWLARVFGGTSKLGNPIVRHRSGHATHFHVRFENPTAELTARRSIAWLEDAGLLPGHRRKKKNGRHPLDVTAAENRAATPLE